MDWLNLNRQTMDSREVVGADPTNRATWFFLLWHCVGQENGGRIVGCRDWSDRSWQQLARVTKEEVQRSSDLWTWEGADLVVRFYPIEKEHELQAKRKGGQATARARWAKATPEADSSATSSATSSAHTEEKGMEEKRREEPERANARAHEQATTPTDPPPGMPRTEEEAKAQAAFVGVPPDYAATVWNELAGCGWVSHTGRPVTAFGPFVKASFNRNQDRNTREDLRRSRSPLPGRPTTNRNAGTFNDDPAIHAAIDAAVTR